MVAQIKLLKFKPNKNEEIEELKDFISKHEIKGFAFAGLKTNGDVVTFVSNTSVLELCGLLAFLEKDIQNDIEV